MDCNHCASYVGKKCKKKNSKTNLRLTEMVVYYLRR